MKHSFLIFLISLISISCSQNEKPKVIKNESTVQNATMGVFDCSGYTFKNAKQRADTLVKYYNLSISQQEAKQLCDNVIFYSFPDSFKDMETLFGFDEGSGAAPLYNYPIGENIIKYFSHLTSIPKDKYYDKYIDICVGGKWQADNIREAFGFHERLIKDTKGVCSRLSKRNDEEIKSIFRFIFDGPHPKNEKNEALYQKLLTKIKMHNIRLSKLLSESYNQLIAEFKH